MQLAVNRIAKRSTGINVCRKMFANQNTVPPDVTTDRKNRFLLFRKQLCNHKGINGAPGRMAAWIAETRFRLTKDELVVDLVRSQSFEMILWSINRRANILFNLFQQRLCLGQHLQIESRS